MKKLTTIFLREHDSYIEALKAAIKKWEDAPSMEDKRELIITIGEIGKEINRMNKAVLHS